MDLKDNLQFIKGIGPKKAELLATYELKTAFDLLNHFPRKHLDMGDVFSIREVGENDLVTVAGNITRVRANKTSRHAERVEAYLHDGTGGMILTWFNAPWIKEKLMKTGVGIFSGKVCLYQGKKQIVNPLCQFEGGDSTTAGGILPVYPPVGNLSQNELRKLVRLILTQSKVIPDPLENFRNELKLLPAEIAYEKIHFPKSEEDYDAARYRFVFEEFIKFQLAVQSLKKKSNEKQVGGEFIVNDLMRERIEDRLPFELTGAQKRTVQEIVSDLTSGKTMNRLLQGDVGSGKTAVAMYFLLLIVANKKQGVLVAPTEVLAEQHFLFFSKLLSGSQVQISYISGSQTSRQRKSALAEIAEGRSQLIIGTHAVFSADVEYHKLGGVVIDEQHRFGVLQRGKLISKGVNPHVLVMTATPIPRTLALTLYGDLDTSILDELPPGRSPIRTLIVLENQRKRVYTTILAEIEKGRQIYIVCPLIEANEDLDFQSCLDVYQELSTHVFSDKKVGLLHGKMPIVEKQEVMQKFKNQEIDILVATQVIEVGVDNPNATLMLIDGAERFGLAQLHQLRGRVGRGVHESMCLLMTKKKEGPSFDRLKVIENSQDGFVIAEADLEYRGVGEYFGIRQSGIPEFKLGHPLKDVEIMVKAQKFVSLMMTKTNYLVENRLLVESVVDLYKGRFSLGSIS